MHVPHFHSTTLLLLPSILLPIPPSTTVSQQAQTFKPQPPCKPPDVRRFDGVRCCLACGEAIFERRQQRSTLDYSSQWSLGLIEYEHDDLNTGLGQGIRLVGLLPGELSDIIKIDIIHVTLGDTNSTQSPTPGRLTTATMKNLASLITSLVRFCASLSTARLRFDSSEIVT